MILMEQGSPILPGCVLEETLLSQTQLPGTARPPDWQTDVAAAAAAVGAVVEVLRADSSVGSL